MGAAPACDPNPGARLADVPSPEAFLGFPLGVGQQRVVTNDEIRRYLAAVDNASDRVVTGTMATSVTGQPLPYAIVSDSAHVTKDGLAKIAEDIRDLRDPRTMAASKAARIAHDDPAIVYIAGNVHGGETSGADASLKSLYELAAGLSCDVKDRNDNLLTVIVPTQNPDGRDANRRQNDFGFDLNRDWFARSQPETDGKIELLRKFPPQVFIDAHEMGSRRYFFPPNADPIHHEIADAPVDWINRIGEANKAGFGYNGACTDTVTTECYFNYDTYDLFYMGYGDTVPATGFGAAGMTYEKGSASAVQDRVQQQFNTQWSTTGWAADNKREVLNSYFKIWTDALAEGKAGELEPNEVVQPDNTVQVPGGRRQGQVLLPAARPAARRRAQAGRAAARDGRRGLRGQGADHGAAGTRVRRTHRRQPHRAQGRLLDPDGAAAEALDPGDAGRRPLRAVPVLLRRVVVEQPAADGHRHHLHRRRPAPQRAARGTAGGRQGGHRAEGRLLPVPARLGRRGGVHLRPARRRRRGPPGPRDRPHHVPRGRPHRGAQRPGARPGRHDGCQPQAVHRPGAHPARRRPVPGHRHLHHVGLARRGALRARQALGPAPDPGHHRRHQQQRAGVHRALGGAGAGRLQRDRRAHRGGPGQPAGLGRGWQHLHRAAQRGHPDGPGGRADLDHGEGQAGRLRGRGLALPGRRRPRQPGRGDPPGRGLRVQQQRLDPHAQHHRHQRAHLPERRHVLVQRLHRRRRHAEGHGGAGRRADRGGPGSAVRLQPAVPGLQRERHPDAGQRRSLPGVPGRAVGASGRAGDGRSGPGRRSGSAGTGEPGR
ncbi:zinc carboxypeptidase [Asanoa ferruginea]|uniref:Zinc carboxypeptidase n=1 Tax=Asanoa ferruginea TaxID=53367 RepID=A0A3D9ZW28_9ACTN|nr:zinc carboxypeptidase [Asanoa ferruginea]